MTVYKKFLQTVNRLPLIIVLRAPSMKAALFAIESCVEGGATNIEVTFSTPQAEKVIAKARKQFPHAYLGAGTVLDKEQAQMALDVGAEFLISPHTFDSLIDWAHKKKICYIPGGATPSELMHIYQKSCAVQKLFPATSYGASGVRGILQPLPQLNLIVTGGVTLATAKDFLSAGAKSVCVGTQLLSDEIWKTSNWSQLKKDAKAWTKNLT